MMLLDRRQRLALHSNGYVVSTKEGDMRKRSVPQAVAVPQDLQDRWQAALDQHPGADDAAALAAWNAQYGPVEEDYNRAVEQGWAAQAKTQAQQRRRRRRWLVAGVAGLALAGGGVWWVSQPPAEEPWRADLKREAACNAQFEQIHGLDLVTRQIDLLTDGQGGWIRSQPAPQDSLPVGDVSLYPADLQAGHVGQARVDREGFVHEDMSYDGAVGCC